MGSPLAVAAEAVRGDDGAPNEGGCPLDGGRGARLVEGRIGSGHTGQGTRRVGWRLEAGAESDRSRVGTTSVRSGDRATLRHVDAHGRSELVPPPPPDRAGDPTATAGRGSHPGFDLGRFEALTFDCYGTLIDWEAGILAAVRPILARHGVSLPDETLLERYAAAEAAVEAGPYRPYREVLGASLAAVAAGLGVAPDPEERAAFAASIADWPPFPDSVAALVALRERFRLGVVTNCDADLFAASNAKLGAPFDWIVTAEEARAYKPSLRPFELVLARIGLPVERVLHVAQSLYHDHVPAKRLALATVWVHRRHDRPGWGATPPAEAEPDIVVPDLATLADLAGRTRSEGGAGETRP